MFKSRLKESVVSAEDNQIARNDFNNLYLRTNKRENPLFCSKHGCNIYSNEDFYNIDNKIYCWYCGREKLGLLEDTLHKR